MLPDSVQDDIAEVVGEASSGKLLAAFLGAGDFCDNTLGVAPDGTLYVIGGGPDEEHGALVQVLVEDDVLRPGWAAPTWRGSATSPSISAGGAWVVVGDGVSGDTFTDPEEMDGRVKVADIAACDDNTDSDEDPAVCAFDHEVALERWPMIGADPGRRERDGDHRAGRLALRGGLRAPEHHGDRRPPEPGPGAVPSGGVSAQLQAKTIQTCSPVAPTSRQASSVCTRLQFLRSPAGGLNAPTTTWAGSSSPRPSSRP